MDDDVGLSIVSAQRASNGLNEQAGGDVDRDLLVAVSVGGEQAAELGDRSGLRRVQIGGAEGGLVYLQLAPRPVVGRHKVRVARQGVGDDVADGPSCQSVTCSRPSLRSGVAVSPSHQALICETTFS